MQHSNYINAWADYTNSIFRTFILSSFHFCPLAGISAKGEHKNDGAKYKKEL